MAEKIKRIKERLVAAAWSPAAESAATLQVHAIEASAHAVRWRGRLRDFAPKRDHLAVVWYAFDEEWDVWRALPEVSGAVDGVEAMRAGDGGWMERSYLAATRHERCLGYDSNSNPLFPWVSFKAELYLNGKHVAEHEVMATTHSTPFEATRLIGFNVALCRPNSWQLVTFPRAIEDAGILVRGFETRDKRPAALVFTFYRPRLATADLGWKKWAIEQGWIKRSDRFVPYERTQGCDAAARSPVVGYRHWTTAEGVHHVGVVVTRSGVSWDEACTVLGSMENLYQPVDVAEPGK